MNYRKTLKTIVVLLCLLLVVSFTIPTPVNASLESQLEEIQRKLQEIKSQKNSLQKEINNEQNLQNQYAAELNKLRAQIDMLNAEIQEKELTIKELELQIQLLEENITQTKETIIKTETEVNSLQLETDGRLVDMYISQKMNSRLDIFVAAEGTDLIKLDLYQTAIQQQTNNMLAELDIKKQKLEAEKEKLEEDKIQIERDEVQIAEQKRALEKNKEDIDLQRAVYYRKRNESLAKIDQTQDALSVITQEEQVAIAESRRLEQLVFDRVNSIPNGAYVTKGTIIGQQGCTGYCTGPHLHFAVKNNGVYTNPCNVIPSGHIPGCGSSTPLTGFPMQGSYVFTSGYGWRWGSFHYGIDIANYNTNAPIYAAHDGYMLSGFEPCNTSNPLCKNGGANYRIICQNKTNCNNGLKTMYWHLK